VIWRRKPLFLRISIAALAVSAPSVIFLGVLAAWGLLGTRPALIAGTIMFVSTALIIGRPVRDLAIIRVATDTLSTDKGGEAFSRRIGLKLAPLARELWRAIVRLDRLWRERVLTTTDQLAAAEAVIAAVPDPLILLDERRQIVRTNTQAAAFIGAVAAQADLSVALRNPSVLAAADAVLQGEMTRAVDFTLTVPIERQLRARIARIDRPSIDSAVAVLSLHDITQLKRAEQMRADFIANASHELRTPLATLLGFIETLRGPARDDREAHERFLVIMHDQASRMARVVEDLLSLSRIELNEHVMPKDRVALDLVLRQVVEALELRASERGMRIQMELAARLPGILGDHDELAQVFQNLVDNAIKYGRAGTGIAVTANNVSRPSHDADTGFASLVSVSVRDQGEGITREHLPRLTERFYRVDTARSREIGGTGLGLAIVKHILNRHRGFLEIESTPGIGSSFTVFLRTDPLIPSGGVSQNGNKTVTEGEQCAVKKS
jgi:two-component system phosphate regulon sensor histidine kinase PhoR